MFLVLSCSQLSMWLATASSPAFSFSSLLPSRAPMRSLAPSFRSRTFKTLITDSRRYSTPNNDGNDYKTPGTRLPLNILSSTSINNIHATLGWDDRIGLQDKWTLEQKGWLVEVEWKSTPYGAGLFAKQNIPKGQILRRGLVGHNLKQFTSLQDIEDFCQDSKPCLHYVKDYLWGFYHPPHVTTNDRGYLVVERITTATSEQQPQYKDPPFVGMWVPGNGLNHSPNPNTVYRKTDDGIDLVALEDVSQGQELVDDYRRHGKATPWCLDFATKYQVSLNFPDCNDFVNQ